MCLPTVTVPLDSCQALNDARASKKATLAAEAKQWALEAALREAQAARASTNQTATAAMQVAAAHVEVQRREAEEALRSALLQPSAEAKRERLSISFSFCPTAACSVHSV